jgi:sensor c-di-GMP phosphodiesterase-like protein
MAQTKAPVGDIFIKGKAVAVAPATAAVATPQIAKAADGKWRCADASGKPCTPAQVQAMQTITKSRSNVKDNLLTMNPDGTLQCATNGKPCTEVEMQSAAAELSKAAKERKDRD